MGTGSYGGGGGGGGGGQGGGAGASGPGYRSKDGKIVSKKKSQSKMEKEVKGTVRALPREYLLNYFASPLVKSVYEHVFELSVHVFQNKTWNGVTQRYGIAGGSGCLTEWVDALMAKFQSTEPNQKVRETVRVCLEDFLVRALGNEVDLFLSGTSAEILKKLDRKVFDSTSAYFLGDVILRLIEREREDEPEEVEEDLWQIAEGKANDIIQSFRQRFYGKDQTTYRDLFRVIQQNNDWFLQELRK